MSIRFLLTYLFIIILCVSCKKENALDCFKSNGKDVVEIRYPGDFRKIKVYDKIDLNVAYGASYRVEVNAGQHIIKNISTLVKNGTLEIKNHSTCNFVRGYKKKVSVKVTLPYIDAVESWGVGTVAFENGFVQDSLRVVTESSGDVHVAGTYTAITTRTNGNGDVYLAGNSNTLHVYMNGTNFLYADNFLVNNYISIETLSMGDCYINMSSNTTFECSIYKNGNIYYKGNPLSVTNQSAQTAKGRLIKEN